MRLGTPHLAEFIEENVKNILTMLILCGMAFATTSREYYNEIYKAGGLDRMASGYSCFPDEDTGKFFIFSQSEIFRQFLMDEGEYKNLSRAQKAQLDKGFIYLRAYYKGIPREPLYLDKDGESYLYEGPLKQENGTKLRLRYTFNWATLRYEEAVGFYRRGILVQSTEHRGYGRCELVGTGVRQTGKWDGERN